jgi:AGZA family xanthine/uracil permease-like MFS transporter
MNSLLAKVDSYFQIKKKGSTIRREMLAGLITFLSMAYILAVNPGILSASGMDFGAVFLATAIATGLTTILMGLYANYPIALAPGMGINAFFAFTVTFVFGKTWQFALAAVLISGLLFLLIALTGLRQKVIEAIPLQLRYAVSAGIGGFIAFIGFVNMGVIVANPATLVGLGDLASPVALLGLFGLAITAVLLIRKVAGAMFLGLAATAVVGLILNNFLGVSVLSPAGFELLPNLGNISFALPSLAPTLGVAFNYILEVVTSFDGWLIVFLFLFVDFFDTAGTLVAVGQQVKLFDAKGKLVGGEKAMIVDAAGTVLGAVLGTSTVTSYIESSTGIQAGGRTGLTAVTTGVLFLLAILLAPFLSVITSVVTAPALIIVGVLMAGNLKLIDWDDLAIAVPAFVTILGMILAYSISTGLALGFILYVITMAAGNRFKEISPVMWVLAAVFVLHFVL